MPVPQPPVSGPLTESPRPVAVRVKQQFWPSVPDPANSSLGKWVPAELQEVRPGPLLPTRGHSIWGTRLCWDGEWVPGASFERCWDPWQGRGGATPCKQAVTACHSPRRLCRAPA